MDKLDVHIRQLLFKHDCVVIPHFGGFVANYVGSKIDLATRKITPPSKSILFNRFLTNNDGLLAHEIAATYDISFAASMELINNCVDEIKHALKQSRRYEMNGVGLFFIDAKNNLCFKQSEGNFLIASFGLKGVSLLPELKPVITVEASNLGTSDTPVIPIQKSGTKRANLWIAAAMAPLILYTAAISYNSNSFGSGFEVAHLNPFSRHEKRTFHFSDLSKNQKYVIEPEDKEVIKTDLKFSPEVETKATHHYTTNNELEKEVDLKPQKVMAKAETTKVAIEFTPYKFNEKAYFVVGGCFKKVKHAKDFIKDMSAKGYNAVFVDREKGLYRVAYGVCDSREDAKSLSDSVRSKENASVWILKKRA